MTDRDRLLADRTTNPMGVTLDMIQRAAKVLHQDELCKDHLDQEEFEPLALRVLTAGLRDTVWEDR